MPMGKRGHIKRPQTTLCPTHEGKYAQELFICLFSIFSKHKMLGYIAHYYYMLSQNMS